MVLQHVRDRDPRHTHAAERYGTSPPFFAPEMSVYDSVVGKASYRTISGVAVLDPPAVRARTRMIFPERWRGTISINGPGVCSATRIPRSLVGWTRSS